MLPENDVVVPKGAVENTRECGLFLSFYKGNGNVFPLLNYTPHHGDVWGSGGITPRTFYLITRMR